MRKIFLGMMAIFALNGFAVEPELNINVLIGKSLKGVLVSGMDLQNKLFFSKSAKSYTGQKTLRFKCDPTSREKLPKEPVKLASVHSLTGLIGWSKNRYKGNLHIISSAKRDGCDLVNELPLEDYLATLLPKEMSSKWPIEALKAQAVAARSYAYNKLKTKEVSKWKGYEAYYDLENSEKHQVNGTYFDATESTFRATSETRGEVLALDNGKVVPIFFHSKCGGKTLRPDQVWSNSIQGYSSVNCPFCHEHGRKNWKLVLPKYKLGGYLKEALDIDPYPNKTSMKDTKKVKLIQDNKLNSKLRFYERDHLKVLKKSRLRSAMGRKRLPSNNYFVKDLNNKVVIRGSGYGHGVGLCQFGAKELALRGFDYKQILSYYFPSFKLKKLYK